MRYSLPTVLVMVLAGSLLQAVETRQERPLVSTQVYYANGIMVVANKAGTAAIHWTKRNDDGGLNYEFRYRPGASSSKEQVGTGTVSPPVASGPGGKTQTAVVISDISLAWGKGDNDWGWVHYSPEDMTVQVVFANLNDLDLSRFRK